MNIEPLNLKFKCEKADRYSFIKVHFQDAKSFPKSFFNYEIICQGCSAKMPRLPMQIHIPKERPLAVKVECARILFETHKRLWNAQNSKDSREKSAPQFHANLGKITSHKHLTTKDQNFLTKDFCYSPCLLTLPLNWKKAAKILNISKVNHYALTLLSHEFSNFFFKAADNDQWES